MRDPRVQSAYMQNVAASLARLGADGARVRAADEALFREIERASHSAWLPVSMNVRWVEAVERAFGWPAALDFLAARVSDQFERPLFRPLVEGGIRLLGLNPGTLVRLIPTALAVVFRDCGEWTAVRTSATCIELRGSALPSELAEHSHWLESIGAGALAMFSICSTRGGVRLSEHAPAAGKAVVEASWDGSRAR